jgi:hypothetical protein
MANLASSGEEMQHILILVRMAEMIYRQEIATISAEYDPISTDYPQLANRMPKYNVKIREGILFAPYILY